MTRNLLVILFSMPLAFGAGCEDTDNGDGDEDELDADTDADADSDTDSDTDFSASIVATIPFEGVGVFVSDDSGAIVKDAAFCEGMTCTYQVPETGRYDVEAEDTYTFIPQSVNVDKPGEFQVSWITGGCASGDPDWVATTVCDEWVPGEYAFPPLEGSYTDEVWGREVDITIDIDDFITIEDVLVGANATMSTEAFYWSNTDADTWVAGTVIDEETFSVVALSAYGNIDEFLFHRN